MGGSPFPVFFSPPELASEKPADAAAPPPATDIAGISAGLAEAFQIDRNNLAKVQAAQAALLPPASLLVRRSCHLNRTIVWQGLPAGLLSLDEWGFYDQGLPAGAPLLVK